MRISVETNRSRELVVPFTHVILITCRLGSVDIYYYRILFIVTIAADRHVHPTIRSVCSLNRSPLGSPTLPISIRLPTVPMKKLIDNPSTRIPLTIPRPTTMPLPLVDPAVDVDEIQAARLIVIRRKKMKKHKLKKLRKRMKYVWAKVRQKRELRKEKAFQAELLTQVSLLLFIVQSLYIIFTKARTKRQLNIY